MSTAVLYHSVTGNTKKVAEAMAEAIGCKAQPVKEYPLDSSVDLMFIGGAIYGGTLDAVMDSFLKALTPEKAKHVVLFSTCITREKSRGLMKDILKAKGIDVLEDSFTCKGRFLILNLRHPNKAELDQAKVFAKSVIAK